MSELDKNKLRVELLMLKIKRQRLQYDWNNRSVPSKLCSLVYNYSKLMYLKLFNPEEYQKIMKVKELVDYIEKHDLGK